MAWKHFMATRPRQLVLSPKELRQRWIAHWGRERRRQARWERLAMVGPYRPTPLPKICHGLTCGANTRAGTPCKRHDLSKHNGRCKLHGGASTGPRTAEGKTRVFLNLHRHFLNQPHVNQTP